MTDRNTSIGGMQHPYPEHRNRSLTELKIWLANVENKISHCRGQLDLLLENARGGSFSAGLLRDRISRLEERRQHLSLHIEAFQTGAEPTN